MEDRELEEIEKLRLLAGTNGEFNDWIFEGNTAKPENYEKYIKYRAFKTRDVSGNFKLS